MDTYADDLAALVKELDLKDAVHVGRSTGGGKVARYGDAIKSCRLKIRL
jgi:non-heme chloroperoxidase